MGSFPKLKQSTTKTEDFYVHDINGRPKTGLVVTQFNPRIKKQGGVFAAMTVTIAETERGWYTINLTTAHTDTLRRLVVTMVHNDSSAEQVNLIWEVVERLPDEHAFPLVAGRGLEVDSSNRAAAVVRDIYSDGAVWIDTVNGVAGAVSFVNGTQHNPVSNIADATTLATNLNLRRFRFRSGSSVTLAQAYTGFQFLGPDASAISGVLILMNSQVLTSCHFNHATIGGAMAASSAGNTFSHCAMGANVTLTTTTCFACILVGPIVLAATGVFSFDRCYASGGAAIIDFGTGAFSSGADITDFHGPIEFRNMNQSGGDGVILTGNGHYTVAATCIGGTIEVHGNWTRTNNGSATITDDGAYARARNASAGVWTSATRSLTALGFQLNTADYVAGAINSTVAPNLDAAITSRASAAALATHDTDIKARLPAALVAGRMDSSVGAIATPAQDALVDAIWDELQSGHGISGSFGFYLDAAISGVSVVSTASALNKLADAFVLTTGTVVTGTFASTHALDGVFHQIADTAGTADFYYEFQLDIARVPVSFQVTATIDGKNDDLNIFGFRWSDSQWIQIGNIGTGVDTSQTVTAAMFRSMVGTGVNDGKVRVRFFKTGLTGSNSFIDQVFVAYAADVSTIVFSGQAVAGGAATIDFPVNASAINDFYFPGLILLVGGTGAGQSRRINSYDGTLRRATVATPWVTQPDATTEFLVLPWASVRVSDLDPAVITEPSIAAAAFTNGKFATNAIDANAFSQAAADKVWATTTRTLTALGFQLTDTDYLAGFFSRIWSNATRSLTALGFQLASGDFATDAISGPAFSQAAADKTWTSAVRTLTALGFQLNTADFALGFFTAALFATDAITNNVLALSAANKVRDTILTDATPFAGANINAPITGVPAAVWANVSRTLTGLGFQLGSGDFAAGAISGAAFAQAAADKVWASTVRTLSALGFQLNDTDFLAAFYTRIWTNAARTLTGLGFQLGAADFALNAIDANAFAQAAADKVWASVSRTLTALGFQLGSADLSTDTITANAFAESAARKIIGSYTGTAGAGSTTTLIIDGGLTQTDVDHWKDVAIVILTGTLAGQVRRVITYNPGTTTLTVNLPFTTTVAIGTQYLLLRVAAPEPPGTGLVDWSTSEREQIRSALGVDGTKTAAVGGQLQNKSEHVPADIWAVATRTLTALGFQLVAGDLATDAIDGNALAESAARKILASYQGTASAGSTSSLIVDGGLTQTDVNHWEDVAVLILTGANAGQIRRVVAFNPSLTTLTVDRAFTSTITIGTLYLLLRTDYAASGGAGGGDWGTAEKEQIRDALGVNGAKTTAVGGQLQNKSEPATPQTIDMNQAVPALPSAATTGESLRDVPVIRAATDLLPEGIKRNAAFNNFQFEMVQTNGTTPAVGLTVTARRVIDGGAYAPTANAVVEVGSGTYRINFASSDLNGRVVTFEFTAAGALTRKITVVTSP